MNPITDTEILDVLEKWLTTTLANCQQSSTTIRATDKGFNLSGCRRASTLRGAILNVPWITKEIEWESIKNDG